jgi:protocatechuate 3,4-dioxygenase beta subunit
MLHGDRSLARFKWILALLSLLACSWQPTPPAFADEPQGVVLKGRVVGDDGKTPLAGMLVEAIQQTPPGGSPLTWEATTDKDGRYIISGMRPTICEVVLSRWEGEVGRTYIRRYDVIIERGKPVVLDICTAPGKGTITGKVVDIAGAPVANFDVSAFGPFDVGWASSPLGETVVYRSSRTDKNGEFSLKGFVTGWVVFEHAYYREFWVKEAPAYVLVDGKSELPLACTIVLERPGAVVEGRVVRESGSPLAGALVSARSPDSVSCPQPITTDEDGKFCIGKFASGMWALKFSAEGFVERTVYVNDLKRDEQRKGLNIVLLEEKRMCHLGVRVLLPDGNSATGVLGVVVWEAGGDLRNSVFPPLRSGPDGQFIGQVYPGKYCAVAIPPVANMFRESNRLPAVVLFACEITTFDAKPGAISEVEVKFIDVSNGGKLRGRVLTKSGVPAVARSMIVAVADDRKWIALACCNATLDEANNLCDEVGQWFLPVLPQGTYELHVLRGPDWQTQHYLRVKGPQVEPGHVCVFDIQTDWEH